MAAELSSHDLTVDVMLPSILDTSANRKDVPAANTKAWVKPEAAAEVIVFLASPAARTINGVLIPLTRGLSFAEIVLLSRP